MNPIFVCCLLTLNSCAHQKSVIDIHDSGIPNAEKKAILILPGFGLKLQGNGEQEAFFSGKGYDVYIPNYLARKSVEKCMAKFEKFMAAKKLYEYGELHVFSYIIGGWIFNDYLAKYPLPNLRSVVYDRSPLQERAPYAVVKDIPVVVWFVYGPVMRDFIEEPYTALRATDSVSVGIVMESKATKVIRNHRESALEKGEISWNPDQFQQSFDDLLYTSLNHDEMYTRFDVIGNEILYFFSRGQFSDSVRKEPFTWDPFEPMSP